MYEDALREVLNRVYRNTDDCEMRISKDCYKLIREALEKQIPRKPVGKIDPMFGDSCTVCLNCENTAIINPFTHSIFKHCPNCGQALDWGNYETTDSDDYCSYEELKEGDDK